MIDVDGLLFEAWQELLDGTISVPVYEPGSVPEDETGNYVECYVESGFGDDTKQTFRNEVVVVTNIVTRFDLSVDTSVANGIDNEIKTLVKTSPGTIGLIDQPGMQVVNVTFQNSGSLYEYDKTKKYYRKIIRYTHRIVQI